MFHPGQRVRVLPVADNYEGYPPSGTKGIIIKQGESCDTVCHVRIGIESVCIPNAFLGLVYRVPVFRRKRVFFNGKDLGYVRVDWASFQRVARRAYHDNR